MIADGRYILKCFKAMIIFDLLGGNFSGGFLLALLGYGLAGVIH